MRDTLIEVLGQAEGAAMYSHEWLVERVLWHLAPEQTGQVFVSENSLGEITGHTIVRVDRVDDRNQVGLFSTTYVHPQSRQSGIGTSLLRRGEEWMRAHGLSQAVMYTDQHNEKLQALYLMDGYAGSPMPKGFVRLSKALEPMTTTPS